MESKQTIKDLIFDDKNFNTGSPFGESLIDKSFEKFGAGRSILIDKNNRIIAGNKSTQKYAEHGGENITIVESDGKTLIAVKRTDIDLDTPEGRELALADNATAKANIVWATDIIAEDIGIEVGESWGVNINAIENNLDYSDKNKEIDTDFLNEKFSFKLEYSEEEYLELKEKIKELGTSPEKIFYDALISL